MGGRMKNQYRLIVSDLDGTLLQSDKTVSEKTREIIGQARREGILFAISTGRALQSVLPFLPQWGLEGCVDAFIATNGVEYMDRNGYEESEYLLSDTAMLELYEKLKAEDACCGVFDNGNRQVVVDRINDDIRRIEKSGGYEAVTVDLVTWLPGKRYGKFFVVRDAGLTAEDKERYGRIRSEAYSGVFSGMRMFEYMDPRVSKAAGVEKICQRYGIAPNQVIALGDSDNDVSMLQYAGMGICMGNGTDFAKEQADYVAGTNDQEGWARSVREVLEGNIPCR